MLLGVPVWRRTWRRHDHDAPQVGRRGLPLHRAYMLAFYVENIFAQGEAAEAMGAAARAHAGVTHDPEKNLADLLEIYERLAKNSAEG